MTTTKQDVSSSSDEMTCYYVHLTFSKTNVTIHEGKRSTPVIYYGNSELFTSNPGIYVSRESKTGPRVAVCRPTWLWHDLSIGLGDGSDGKLQEMAHERFTWSSSYRFEHDGIIYDWRNRQSNLVRTTYDCFDGNGKVCATISDCIGLHYRKGAIIEIRDGLAEDLVHLLIAGALGIWSIKVYKFAVWGSPLDRISSVKEMFAGVRHQLQHSAYKLKQ